MNMTMYDMIMHIGTLFEVLNKVFPNLNNRDKINDPGIYP